jgi:hypothetical protein
MLVYQCAEAQDYVVTAKGDTLKGDVKPLAYGAEKKVQVTTSDKKKNIFSIFQTRAYSYKGSVYQPVKSAKGYVFMKLIKSGYLSLYAFQMDNQVTYDGLYLTKRDGSGLEVPNLTFKKHMQKFVEECPDVEARIDNGELGKKNIESIVDEFNACITNKTVNHEKVIVQSTEQAKKIGAWDDLEQKVKNKSDFEGKNNALEMITEIKSKIKRSEKVPNFLLEGLKSSLAETGLSTELQTALNDLNN